MPGLVGAMVGIVYVCVLVERCRGKTSGSVGARAYIVPWGTEVWVGWFPVVIAPRIARVTAA
jgi:hypothetical protein